MNRALSCRGLALLAALDLLTWSLSWCGAAAAAEVKTSAYAHDTSASNPVPDPLSQDLLGTGSPKLSSSIRRDSTRAHAQAWASATLTSTGVTKSASGTGWLDAGTPTYDAKSETWSSFAFGSPYIVHSQNPGTTIFQVRIPPSATLTLPDTGYDSSQFMLGDLLPTPQTFSRTQLPTGTHNSFFDIFFQLDIEVVQDLGGGNVQDFPVFHGSVNFGADGQVIKNGNSVDPFLTFVADSNGQLTAQFANNFVFPQSIPIVNNIPFDLTFQALMRGGDGGLVALDGTFDAAGSYPAPQVGGDGSFTGIFEMINPPPAGTFLDVVPEPSALTLAGIAAISFAVCARRRRTP